MKSIVIFINELSTPVKYCSIFYFGSIFLYNCFCSYADAKLYLYNYRTKTLNKYELDTLNSEWDAVKYGAQLHCYKRFWDSIIWPIKLINNVIPYIVLTLNKKKEN